MPEAENHLFPGATNDTWRAWLMTGVRRNHVDRRRMRGANKGLKRILLEGMTDADGRPHAWKDFSGAMIRHAVDEAVRSLPQQDNQVLKLAYFGGYSNREIAGQVGLTEATVQRRLRSALSRISEHIQRGGELGRRAAFAALVWLGARWLQEGTGQLAQVAAVAGATAIIALQPAASSPVPTSHPDLSPVSPPVTTNVGRPVPSPTSPGRIDHISVPSVDLPVQVPALPALPVKVKPPAL